jgi:hypothetical protein
MSSQAAIIAPRSCIIPSAREEPQTEMVGAVTPSVEVRRPDADDRADGVGDPLDDRSEGGGQLRRQVVETMVVAGFEDGDHRQAARREPGLEVPLLVSPDHRAVRLGARRTRFAAGLAAPRRLGQDRLVQRHHLDIASERKERQPDKRLG